MKLKTQLFHVIDSKGDDINLESKDVRVILNGEVQNIKVQDLFGDEIEFDDNEIYGNSLLSYYNIEDGKLVVEGSTIELATAPDNERILITRISRPAHCDTSIPFEHVQKFAEFFKVAKPDEVFFNLTDEEKQIFLDERTSRTNKQKSDAEAQVAEEEKRLEEEKLEQAQKILDAKEAEAKLKESIDPKFVQNKKEYNSTRSFYDGIEFKEYIHNPYHFFYGSAETHFPCILIKRGETWWQEVDDSDMEIVEENDKKVVIEFPDWLTLKILTLDLETGKINITDADTK